MFAGHQFILIYGAKPQQDCIRFSRLAAVFQAGKKKDKSVLQNKGTERLRCQVPLLQFAAVSTQEVYNHYLPHQGMKSPLLSLGEW